MDIYLFVFFLLPIIAIITGTIIMARERRGRDRRSY